MACNIFLTLPNGAKMPAVGYGTYQAKDDSLEAGLEEALKIGYRHIDTAQMYENEHIVGKVLKRWFDSGKLKREDIFLTTKLSPFQMVPENIEEVFKESLKKLQVDYVDLFLVHAPFALAREGEEIVGRTDFHYLDVWKKMENIYDSGKAKAIGISNFNVRQVENLLKNCRIKPANNQIDLHIYLQQKDIIDVCHKNNITIVGYSSLRSRGLNKLNEELSPLANKTAAEIAQKYSKTRAQILLRFGLEMDTAVIPKSVTSARIAENFDVFNFKLDADDMAKLRSLDKGPNGRAANVTNASRVSEHPEYPFK